MIFDAASSLAGVRRIDDYQPQFCTAASFHEQTAFRRQKDRRGTR
jgi:hypothetical protein